MTTTQSLTIRQARRSDQRALWRLAALDSAAAPSGETLIAERDGHLVAAVDHDGRAIADPFQKTAAIISMLRAYTRTPAWAA